MEVTNLDLIGISMVYFDSRHQYYLLEFKDKDGKLFSTRMSCRLFHVESIEKAISRIIFNTYLPFTPASITSLTVNKAFGGDNETEEG